MKEKKKKKDKTHFLDIYFVCLIKIIIKQLFLLINKKHAYHIFVAV
jgi:hypothetical protein